VNRGMLNAHPEYNAPCQLIEGLTFGLGYFWAACGNEIYRSVDGVTWGNKVATTGSITGHPALDYQAGKFTLYGDNGTTYQSTDGLTWTTLAGVNKGTYCNGTYVSLSACAGGNKWIAGAYFESVYQNKIARSTTGSNFVTVYSDPQNDAPYESRSIAEGYVAP
jgi:hypothetical protein